MRFFPFLVIIILSVLLYFLAQLLLTFPPFQHIIISFYLGQLKGSVLLLPFLFLFSFFLSYWLMKRTIKILDFWARLREPLFLSLVFLLSFILTNSISLFFYEHIPQDDDVSLLFQAKIFAQGQLYASAPKGEEFFRLPTTIIYGGKWFSQYQPGHALALMLGYFFKIPWIIGPLLGSCSLLIIYFLAKEMYDRNLAKMGILFLVFSPFFLSISGSHSVHTSTLFYTSLTVLFFHRTIKRGLWASSFLTGFFLGALFLCRSYTALAIATPLVLFGIWSLAKREIPKKALFFSILGFLPFLVFQLGDNLLLTGNPFRYPYALFGGDYNSLGFGLTKGVPTYGLIGHSPLKGLINLLYNLLAISLHLFGWPAFSLIFVLFSLFRSSKNRSDYLSFSIIISLAIYYFFYWYNGVSPMGPRYYYEAIPFFVFLTVRGLPPFLSLLNRWKKGFPSFSSEKFAVSLIVGLFFINIFFYIPGVYRFFKESPWGCSALIAQKVKEEGLHNAVVIVRDSPEGDYKREVRNMFNYSSAFIYNSPTLASDILYAKDLGDIANAALFRLFPERKFYLFEYREDLPLLYPYREP